MTKEEIIGEIVKLRPLEQNELIVELVEKMPVMGLNELIKTFQARFGVTAMSMPAGMGMAPPVAAETEKPVEEEKTAFDVILSEVGDKKIPVIKVVHEITSLGLKEAKELVDSAPAPIKQQIPQEEANEIKAKLEEVGAKVELK